MRTPNAECVICQKKVYRRPNELIRVRYVTCSGCRSASLKQFGLTTAQKSGLGMGPKKGRNNRIGHVHSESSKMKCSESNKAYWAANPQKLAARGEKTRGENHCYWKGGSSRLNTSIRRMSEHRKWMDAVKLRDGNQCVMCGCREELESHHIKELSVLVFELGIKNRDDARAAPELWDVANGETLCGKCHCERHGRKYSGTGNGRRSTLKNKPRPVRSRSGMNNPNWKGGIVSVRCGGCGRSFLIKPGAVSSASRVQCSRWCKT